MRKTTMLGMIALAGALLLGSRAAQAQFGTNLIVNGNAEAGSGDPNGGPVASIPGWATSGGLTVAQYSSSGGLLGPTDPGPAFRGKNFFAGGNNSVNALATQVIDVSAGATSIDAGGVPYTLSGYLGGLAAKDDNASLSVTFEAANGLILGAAGIGPVTAAERNNVSGLLLRSTRGVVPRGTRMILVILQMMRVSGTYNDAFADNLSLVLGTPVFDLNGSGQATLLFQKANTNQIALWFMNGMTVVSTGATSQSPVAGYKVVGVGDFNGDGQPDLVFQNQTNGQIVIWYLNGTNVIGGAAASLTPAAGYKVVGVGDFNGDGQPDLVFQNQTTGQIVIWFMNGASVIGGAFASATPGANYQVVGVGDVNGDGRADIVFQNSATGQVAVWFMNGTKVIGGGPVNATVPAGLQLRAVTDLNGDGKADLVFQNLSTGQVTFWLINGTTVTGTGQASMIPAGGDQIVGPR